MDVQLDRSRTSRRNLLLAALPAKDFALLAPHLKEAVLEQGVVLQEQGDRIDQVYFPHDGIISLLAVMRHGDAIETATIGYEGAVGSFAGLGVRRDHTALDAHRLIARGDLELVAERQDASPRLQHRPLGRLGHVEVVLDVDALLVLDLAQRDVKLRLEPPNSPEMCCHMVGSERSF